MAVLETQVRQICENDYQQVATFLEESTGGTIRKHQWLDRFQCWWNCNPLRPGEVTGWILEDEANTIQGFLGCITMPFFNSGKQIQAYAATSWFVNKNFRKSALELLKPFLQQQPPGVIMCTTPAEDTTLPFFQHILKFYTVKRKWLEGALFVPIEVNILLEYLIVRKMASNWAKPLLIVRWLFVPFMGLLTSLNLKRLSRAEPYDFQIVRKFGDEHLPLWKAYRNKYRFIASRTPEALNWLHFGVQDMSEKRAIVDVRSKEKELVGWMVFNVSALSYHGREYHYLELVDLLLQPDPPVDRTIIIRAALYFLRQSDKRIMFIKIPDIEGGISEKLSSYGKWLDVFNPSYLIKSHQLDISDFQSILDNDFYCVPADGDRGFF